MINNLIIYTKPIKLKAPTNGLGKKLKNAPNKAGREPTNTNNEVIPSIVCNAKAPQSVKLVGISPSLLGYVIEPSSLTIGVLLGK